MAELTKQAGLVPPEFEEHGASLAVTFRPTQYVPPSRVTRDISEFQQEILQILSELGPAPLGTIRAHLKAVSPERTVQDNLQMLRQLDLVELKGWARGARWMLKGEHD